MMICSNTNNPKFPCRTCGKNAVLKMSMTKIKLFNVTFKNIGFLLNITTLSIQIIDIFKPVMNPVTAQNVVARFFFLIPYHKIYSNRYHTHTHPYHTLIDNISSNIIDPDIISGNLTATISNCLPQFAIIPNMFGNIASNKSCSPVIMVIV